MKNYFLLFGILLFIPFFSEACTNYLVTKTASVDGSTMISYAADSHIRYGELYWRPASDWPEGSMRTIYDRGTNKPLGQIPQVAHTYKVVGFMNEHQVAIGETTFGGRNELLDTTGIIDYGSMMFIVLERSKTAREAIKIMIELFNEYGYASSGETFSIADPNEVWIVELVGKGVDLVYDKKQKKYINKNKGVVFVAIKIPEGYVSAHANHSRITNFPLENMKNSISCKNLDKIFDENIEVVYAHDVISFAKEKSYFSGKDEDFSFSQAYAPITYDAARFCELRVWAMYNEISDDMAKYWDAACGNDLETRLPLYIKPNRKLSQLDLFKFFRNYLQGTELDMTTDIGAEPSRMPYRWRPLTFEYNGKEYLQERVTVTQQTGFSFVAQMRSNLPNPIGGVYWLGVDDAGSCVYTPFYVGITKPASKWAEGYGDILTYKDDAAFWVFNRLAHFKYLFYNRVMPEIEKHQSFLENKYVEYLDIIDETALKLYENSPEKAEEFLTEYSCNTANALVDYWKELDNFLLVKYLDGNVKPEENGEFLRNPWGYPKSIEWPGYSDEWKKNLIEKTGERFLMK
ncbi:MAG: C69 family dipeptidase [Bacteroidales bacterium]|jgi:dipeptidase|nr:C69 family dipeptidase [Bacteroidales bacterium]MCK9498848.1 C69 family dipeptidase [Bacteroidales bacterium]MDY0314773.1 C69 family dipeptidase [Bacteroidales bacterium]